MRTGFQLLLLLLISAPGSAGAGAPCSTRDAARNLYFGDLHVHTSLSHDAYVVGTKVTPEGAYRFAKGETIEVVNPIRSRRSRRIERPLDFAAVTDHAELLGAGALCRDPKAEVYETKSCKTYRNAFSGQLTTFADFKRSLGAAFLGMQGAEVCGEDGVRCREAAYAPWAQIRAAAERFNAPCEFTTFAGYEFTEGRRGSMVHRNVIFRTSTTTELPVSFNEAPTPIDLWQQLRDQCLDAEGNCDALAIPHNSNMSNGQMFEVEYGDAKTPAEQAAIARLRARLEPSVEMFQMKGDSECRDGMWDVVGVSDELCGFEKARDSWPDPPEDCRGGTGFGAPLGKGCVSRLDYVRYALIEGLREEARIGVNPYKFGFIASTDAHDGTAGDVEEDSIGDDVSLAGPFVFGRGNPGGLAGVWAEENTRAALFDSIRRRETFATSGPRMAVRFFGGWGYDEALCADPKFAERAYQGGVPMGGDLPPRAAGAKAPVFVINALRDPRTPEHPGGLLQRAQIVKGWVGKDGRFHQAVYDAVGNAANGADVDLATCEPRGLGADSLCGVWRDPDFDPKQSAVYYARVLENPSCRYTTRICNNTPPDEKPGNCSDPRVVGTIQERAWTSPIWYEPGV